MHDTNCVVDVQLLKDCLYAFNDIPNRKVKDGLKTYDLARKLDLVLNHQQPIICFTWSIQDVHTVRGDLDDEQAMNVLLLAKRQYDANVGINWNNLKSVAESIYPIPK